MFMELKIDEPFSVPQTTYKSFTLFREKRMAIKPVSGDKWESLGKRSLE